MFQMWRRHTSASGTSVGDGGDGSYFILYLAQFLARPGSGRRACDRLRRDATREARRVLYETQTADLAVVHVNRLTGWRLLDGAQSISVSEGAATADSLSAAAEGLR